MQATKTRHGRAIVRGATMLLALASAAMGAAQISPGGVLFFGERVIRESVPSQAPIIQAASNIYGVTALRADGTVVCWGDATSGRLDLPADLTGVIQVAAGNAHSLALKSDGTVVAWGVNDVGQCNAPATLSNVKSVWAGDRMSFAILNGGGVVWWGAVPTPPSGLDLSDVVQISAGENFVCALRANGTVVAWGANSLGQATVPTGLSKVVQVRCGQYHALALKIDGTVVAWGENGSGQATVPSGLNGVVSLAAGYAHSVALKGDGTLVTWGLNAGGQSTPPAGATNVVSICANYATTVAIKADGSVVAFGDSNYNQTTPANLAGVSRLAGRAGNLVGITEGDKVVYFGRNDVGQAMVPPDLKPVASVSVGLRHVMALRKDGKVTCWGNNGVNQLDVPGGLTMASFISAGQLHSAAIGTTGNSYCWGLNTDGQCNIPSGVGPLIQLAPGYTHTAGLRSDGTVVVWGDGWFGQKNVPAGLSGVVAIASGPNHIVALKSDGTAVTWGSTNGGQIPATLQNAVAISAGDYHGVALRADGSVAGWGSDFAKQISPLSSLANVAEVVASGNYTACLLKMHVSVAPYLIPGGQIGYGTVHLAAPAPTGGQIVGLSSGDPTLLTVPASIVVPAGARSVDFPIQAGNATTVKQAMVFATLGTLTQRCMVTVSSSPFTITYSRTQLVGGSTTALTGTITLPKNATSGGIAVNLSSTLGCLSVPATVTVPSGKTSVKFAIGHSLVTSQMTGSITATRAGFSVVTPMVVDPFAITSFVVSPTTVLGSQPVSATIKLNASPATDLAIPVTSSVPLAIADKTLTIPAGGNQVTKSIPTSAVSASTAVDLTANLGGATSTKSVKVYQAISYADTVGALYGNGSMTVQAVSPIPAPVGGLILNVTTSKCQGPATVTIPEGQKSVTFTVIGQDVTANTSAKVTLSALASSVTVTRSLVANLVTGVSLSDSSVVGGSATSVTGTVSLTGPVAVDTTVTLTNSVPSVLSVPSSVVIPAGASSVTFAVTHLATTSNKTVKVTATRLGVSKAVSIDVTSS